MPPDPPINLESRPHHVQMMPFRALDRSVDGVRAVRELTPAEQWMSHPLHPTSDVGPRDTVVMETDGTYSHGLSRCGDVLVAIQLPQLSPKEVSLTLAGDVRIPARKHGDFWVLDTPLIALWLQFRSLWIETEKGRLMDGERVTTRWLWWGDSLRREVARLPEESGGVFPIDYPDYSLVYGMGELRQVQAVSPEIATSPAQ